MRGQAEGATSAPRAVESETKRRGPTGGPPRTTHARLPQTVYSSTVPSGLAATRAKVSASQDRSGGLASKDTRRARMWSRRWVRRGSGSGRAEDEYGNDLVRRGRFWPAGALAVQDELATSSAKGQTAYTTRSDGAEGLTDWPGERSTRRKRLGRYGSKLC